MAEPHAHRLARGRHSPGRRDPLGLKRALADRLLLCLVAAMALLACLALAGRGGAETLALRWQHGAQAAMTVQIPEPSVERMARAIAVLQAQPEVAAARILDPARLRELLRPWLGDAQGLALPGVIEVQLAQLSADPVLIGDRLALAVPGAVTEAHGIWVARIAALATAVQAVALAVLVLVAAVAAAVGGVATRTGIIARQEAIIVLHGRGATDGEIARRIAARALAGRLGRRGGVRPGHSGADGDHRLGGADRWRRPAGAGQPALAGFAGGAGLRLVDRLGDGRDQRAAMATAIAMTLSRHGTILETMWS